jgi:TolB protein
MLHVLLVFIFAASYCYGADEVISISIGSQPKKGTGINTMPLYCGIIKKDYDALLPFISTVKSDIERSGQFKVTTESRDLPKSKQEISDLAQKGFTLAFFANLDEETSSIEWRLYDTPEAQMIKGRKSSKKSTSTLDTAHMLSRDLWNELMGSEGPFASKICYIKKIRQSRHKSTSELCVCDYDGRHEKALFRSPRISIAPCWSLDQLHPFIVFSEFTNCNVRLVSVDLHGKRHVVLDHDGTMAGVSFSALSQDIVYGRSGGIWLYHFDKVENKGIHTLVIKEKDACACPTLLGNGDIIYCCQGKIKKYIFASQGREMIIGEGYCVGPAYHETSGKLAYSRRIKGVMQLFIYDMMHKSSQQLTYDRGDKIDSCWSPCGTWLAYCEETGSKSRIWTINVKTGKKYQISPEGSYCCCPAWSPSYSVLPDVS